MSHSHKINQHLSVQPLGQRVHELRCLFADDNEIALRKNIREICDHQRGNMRDCLLNITAVGPDQLRQGNLLIIDGQLVALAQEPFNENHDRAFPQIIRARLEAQAQHANPLFARLLHQIDGMIEVFAIAFQERTQGRAVSTS